MEQEGNEKKGMERGKVETHQNCNKTNSLTKRNVFKRGLKGLLWFYDYYDYNYVLFRN